MKPVLLLVVMLLSIHRSTLYSQTFDHIGSEEGLASQLCQHLIEDDYGNIWITSFLNLQKYDDYKVTVIPTDDYINTELDILD